MISRPPISIVVLTKNEEHAIKDCIESVRDLDVHVLDSGSTDRTVAIARSLGASIHEHPFHGFGQQRNWAIDNIQTRHDWQFHLDADERMTPELLGEIAVALSGDPPHAGFHVPSKLMFAGRWLRHAGEYPTYQVRLIHRSRFRFVDHGHGQREAAGLAIGTLKNAYAHHAFSKGLDDWLKKHVDYARRDVEQAMSERARVEELFTLDPVRRRRALKRLSFALPGRYFMRLAYMLVVRRAFLDGASGLTYAHMRATYDAMLEVYARAARADEQP